MRLLNGVYTQHSNQAHGRTGHMFQGRFKAMLVDADNDLLELARDVVLNPVRAAKPTNHQSRSKNRRRLAGSAFAAAQSEKKAFAAV